jgi:S-layer homology domain
MNFKIIAKLNSKATTALLLSFTMGLGVSLPFSLSLLNPTPVVAQSSRFNDVSANYWAANFINELVAKGVIVGFPDGRFKPDAPVTRAEFAAMLQKAFPNKTRNRTAIAFTDVSANYWGRTAINNANEMGFLSGYPGQIFKPEQNIPREQVLVALANGLNYSPRNNVDNILSYYNDENSISNYARSNIAAATENRMVVNYANLKQLNPTRDATRAEVAAFIYQSLVAQGDVAAINSSYIVTQQSVTTDFRIPNGTMIPVTYTAKKILLTKTETVPVTLTVASNIVTNNGVVLVRQGSQIKGEFRPVQGGTQFFAQQLILPNGQTYNVSATSAVITKTETVSKGINLTNLLKNAALGTAASAISAITGDKAIATEELLIGAGGGILATLIPQFLGMNKIDLLVVEPETNVDLTLNSDLVMNN